MLLNCGIGEDSWVSLGLQRGQISQFFLSGPQSIRASALVLPMNIQDWFPLRWTGWISLQSKGYSRVFSNFTVQKHQFFSAQLSLWSNSHIHTWLPEKPYLFRWTFVTRIMSLFFNMLSRLVIAFLSRNNYLLISWLQSPSAVILEPKKIKSVTDDGGKRPIELVRNIIDCITSFFFFFY